MWIVQNWFPVICLRSICFILHGRQPSGQQPSGPCFALRGCRTQLVHRALHALIQYVVHAEYEEFALMWINW
jgi:hypothetical protein